MLLNFLFRLVEPIEGRLPVTFSPERLLVRLRPEYAGIYAWVPAGVWLAAHRRLSDDGVVWLDADPASRGGERLPLGAQHLDVLTPDTDPAAGGPPAERVRSARR